MDTCVIDRFADMAMAVARGGWRSSAARSRLWSETAEGNQSICRSRR